MAKQINTIRPMNQPLADRAVEIIEDAIADIEENGKWSTVTVELRSEAGKIRSVRKTTNETWQDAEERQKKPQVLTASQK